VCNRQQSILARYFFFLENDLLEYRHVQYKFSSSDIDLRFLNIQFCSVLTDSDIRSVLLTFVHSIHYYFVAVCVTIYFILFVLVDSCSFSVFVSVK
jgi:hypothetical protein